MESRLAHHPRWAVVMPLAIGLLVRLLGIASRPIWYDEAFAVLFSEKGPQAMLMGTLSLTGAAAADVHPLGYYTLLWAWMGLLGESLPSVRALSVFAGMATIVVAYFLALDLFGQRAALAAGVLTAILPFQVHYSQEIRMYAFLGLWLMLATYSYWRGSQSRQWTWWAGFAIFGALAMYTHNLAAFYMLSIALWPLLSRDWHALKQVTLAGAASLLLYLPWLLHLPAQLTKVSQAYWVAAPRMYRLLTLLIVFVTNLPLPPPALALGLSATLALFGTALIVTVRAARIGDVHRRRAGWVLYLAFAAPLLMFLASQWQPVYVERALLTSGVVFGIWLAWAVTHAGARLPERVLLIVMLGVGVVIGLYQHLAYAGFPYAPYRGLVANLETRRQSGDAIVHSSKLSMLPAVFFDRDLPQAYVGDPPGSSVDTLAASTQMALGLEASPDMASAVGDARRVWFVLFARSNEEYLAAGLPEHPHLTWLQQRYVLTETQHWGDLELYLFSLEQPASASRQRACARTLDQRAAMQPIQNYP